MPTYLRKIKNWGGKMDQFDIQLYTIAEQLDRIEKKIDKSLYENKEIAQGIVALADLINKPAPPPVQHPAAPAPPMEAPANPPMPLGSGQNPSPHPPGAPPASSPHPPARWGFR